MNFKSTYELIHGDCMEILPDDYIIIDPFMGSGTTGVACRQLNRKFIGIELDKEYYEIAYKRISEVYNED